MTVAGKIQTLKKKITRAVTVLATGMAASGIPAFAQVQITPQAPQNVNGFVTILGYLEWLGLVGGVFMGLLLAGIKIALMHDMEGGKRAALYSVLGGVIISAASYIVNQFI